MLMNKDLIRSRKIKFFLFMALILYFIMLIGVVFLNRERQEIPVANLNFFYSNPESWDYLSFIERRNLILNIILFIPFGFLVPLCLKCFRGLIRIGLLGFFVSLAIEVVQYITCLGIFEYDDLFNNTIGTLIGYGMIVICFCIYEMVEKLKRKSIIPL